MALNSYTAEEIAALSDEESVELHRLDHNALHDRYNELTPGATDDEVVPAARLGSGTPTVGNFLRGDGSWADPGEIALQGGMMTLQGYPLVIDVTNPHPDISDVAATGDGVTDDYEAIQNCLDWLKGIHAQEYMVRLPRIKPSGQTAQYRVSKPLRVWTQTTFFDTGRIEPTDDFDWVNHPHFEDPLFNPSGVEQPGDIALVEIWNDANGRGGFSRLHVERRMLINCRGQAGSIGLLFKSQQDSHIKKLRIENARSSEDEVGGPGMVLWGQDAKFDYYQTVGCDVGLYLGGDISGNGHFGVGAASGCKFMTFDKLNPEQFSDAGVRTNCDGPNWFRDLHFEANDMFDAIGFDAQNGAFTVANGWGTLAGPAWFVIGDMSPTPPPKSTYWHIQNVRASSPSSTRLMIDDKVRDFQYVVNNQEFLEDMRGAFQGDTQTDWDMTQGIIGDEGGHVWMGGVNGASAVPTPAGHSGAQFTTRPNNNQDQPQVRHHNQSDVLRSGVDEDGYPLLLDESDGHVYKLVSTNGTLSLVEYS